ncbi:SGNH/GDSL hydrolase family protein [Nitrospinota bacterium]
MQKFIPSFKKFFMHLFILFLGLLASIFLIEGYLQFAAVKAVGKNMSEIDPELGWRHMPGDYKFKTEEFSGVYRINSKGFQDLEFDPKQKHDLTIIALGDSHTFAIGVEQNDVWPNVLERQLGTARPGGKIAVHNFGVIAYSLGQEYFLLMHEGLQYNPHLVILGFSMATDIFDILPPRRGGFIYIPDRGRKYFDLSAGGRLLQKTELVGKTIGRGKDGTLEGSLVEKIKFWMDVHSKFYKILKRGPVGLYAASFIRLVWGIEMWPASSYVLSVNLSDNQKFAWRLAEKVLANFRNSLSSRGVQFLVVVLPYYPQVYDTSYRRGFAFTDNYSQFAGNERLKEICRRNKIHCLDLTWAFRNQFQKSGRGLHFPTDGHPNKRGHRLIGRKISEYLNNNPTLLRPPGRVNPEK